MAGFVAIVDLAGSTAAAKRARRFMEQYRTAAAYASCLAVLSQCHRLADRGLAAVGCMAYPLLWFTRKSCSAEGPGKFRSDRPSRLSICSCVSLLISGFAAVLLTRPPWYHLLWKPAVASSGVRAGSPRLPGYLSAVAPGSPWWWGVPLTPLLALAW